MTPTVSLQSVIDEKDRTIAALQTTVAEQQDHLKDLGVKEDTRLKLLEDILKSRTAALLRARNWLHPKGT